MVDKVKQVIVVRKDLNMPTGKLAAQVAHAAMAFMTNSLRNQLPLADPYSNEIWHGIEHSQLAAAEGIKLRTIEVDRELSHWVDGSFTKAVVSVNSEAELLELYEKAKIARLRHTLITDEGRTVFNGVSTHTCIAIGPNYIDAVNAVTGKLPLYK
jgi:Uncharacterized conserved protein